VENSKGVSKKTRNRTTYNPVISLLCTHPKERKTCKNISVFPYNCSTSTKEIMLFSYEKNEILLFLVKDGIWSALC
jgi:hypothetical protein